MTTHDHHHAIDRLIIVSSIISGISLLPEVLHVLKEMNASTMSAVTLFIIFMNSIVWLLYGMHCGLRSLLISSSLSILSSGILILSQFIW